mmetsp:Transcript_33007/g.110175  ORF Transcript_33007/g.110175 Transcript_33007/m.110175 type:complete len:349 (-) Transcript_33007:421-1467(-)
MSLRDAHVLVAHRGQRPAHDGGLAMRHAVLHRAHKGGKVALTEDLQGGRVALRPAPPVRADGEPKERREEARYGVAEFLLRRLAVRVPLAARRERLEGVEKADLVVDVPHQHVVLREDVALQVAVPLPVAAGRRRLRLLRHLWPVREKRPDQGNVEQLGETVDDCRCASRNHRVLAQAAEEAAAELAARVVARRRVGACGEPVQVALAPDRGRARRLLQAPAQLRRRKAFDDCARARYGTREGRPRRGASVCKRLDHSTLGDLRGGAVGVGDVDVLQERVADVQRRALHVCEGVLRRREQRRARASKQGAVLRRAEGGGGEDEERRALAREKEVGGLEVRVSAQRLLA